MLKNLSKLEVIIEGKLYQLLCDNDSPLSHVKEAIFQFNKYVAQVEDAIKAQQVQSQPEQAPAPEQPKSEEEPKPE